MKQLRPVDIFVDIDIPESGFFADETMDPPSWTTRQMSKTFFGDTDTEWLRPYFNGRRPIRLDGEPLTPPPRGASNYYWHWRLIDVERFAQALAKCGYLDHGQLYRTLEQVRIIAETWGYLPPQPVPLLGIEDHDPTRRDVYAVEYRGEIIDGINGTEVRRWAREHDYPTGYRGRIPRATMDAYLVREKR